MAAIDDQPTEDERATTDPDGRRTDPGTVSSVALSIVCHPALRRIGERVALGALGSGARFRLSRTEPFFRRPDGGALGPLAVTAMSRRPIEIEVTRDDRVIVDPCATKARLRLDGVTLDGPIGLTRNDVARGVVLEIGARIVLLLHLLSPPPPALEGARDRELGLIGESSGMAQVRAEVLRVADLEVPVLIRGESGVGKELVAAAIHRLSTRSARPFVPVNMAAIPATTAASALFGHARGAFTGAVRAHRGFFADADGGTLFLDEIGAAPLDVQAMLLRVLDTGEVQTVGTTMGRKVDVRIIAATDAPLDDDVREGSFRLPLLHRLCGYQIQVPRLAARRDDVARLARHYFRVHLESIGASAALGEDGAEWVDPITMARLCRYQWPGNVRQLINVTRQLVISSRGYPRLMVDPATDALLPPAEVQAKADTAAESPVQPTRPADIDEATLLAALAANGWSMAATARALGIARSSLYLLVERSPELRVANALGADEIRAAVGACAGDLDAAAARLHVSTHALKMRAKKLAVVLQVE